FCLDFVVADTTTPQIYTLSLHDALPICPERSLLVPEPAGLQGGVVFQHILLTWVVEDATKHVGCLIDDAGEGDRVDNPPEAVLRSEEHTSELQSRENLVCRLLLEKKKK